MITRSFYLFDFFVNNQQNRLYVSVNHLSSDGSHYTPNFFKIETQICQQLCVICKNDRVHSLNVLLAEYMQLQKLKDSFLVSVANFIQHTGGKTESGQNISEKQKKNHFIFNFNIINLLIFHAICKKTGVQNVYITLKNINSKILNNFRSNLQRTFKFLIGNKRFC